MMTASRKRAKNKRTLKTYAYYLCRFENGELVKIAKRQRYGWICKLQEQYPGSFVVSESVAIDPEADDLGTMYYFDENGGNMERYF